MLTPALDRYLDRFLVLLDRGPVERGDLAPPDDQCFGLMVLEGFLVVNVCTARGRASWLVGADDVLRPWDMAEISLLGTARWRALTMVKLLRLDQSFHARASEDPESLHALVSHTTRGARWLLAKSLVVSAPRVRDRLLMLFALYGERWGKVSPDGIHIDVRLTHEVLAGLCGCRRPSVTMALQGLERDGALLRTARGGWLLRERPEPA